MRVTTKTTIENDTNQEFFPTVAGGPLALYSKEPATGFFRDGYCRVTSEDPGNHSIAAVVTDKFLDFSADKGNNLKDKGVKDGMKWCLCAHRWQEAYDAFQKGDLAKDAVPRVYLHASDEAALKTVSYKQLKEFEREWEAGSQTNRQQSHINPESTRSGVAKESKEIGKDVKRF